ncbi:MAG: glycosyltransferase [Candidatus Cyclonatronum sp.]|uniref:glycosyltransferase n=1 Tax=Cyclonatronum sp. TaxID=3024185 RepID=UPI0025B83E0C|nr:glycosyltransferase [Cyclonatronum sp.]MCH8487523.1 glycosyltransferase [Cyclonatronum sp.]
MQKNAVTTPENGILVSLIIPVYNRAAEVRSLLGSISSNTAGEETWFEVILVDDGSEPPLAEETETRDLSKPWLKIIRQENAGPGPARNTGAAEASGSWLLFLDSDCELPAGFLGRLRAYLSAADEGLWLFGGPDTDRDDFTLIQKAINYAMTSPLTTGGIRGGKKALDRFYPRSYNMGVRASAFREAGGFEALRFGEDLDLSMRLIAAGGRSALVPGLAVYHRRRTSFRAFFRQVFNSGMARVVLEKRHPGTMKLVHLLPSFFVFGLMALPVLIIAFPPAFFAFMVFVSGLLFHAMLTTRSLRVSLLSFVSVFVQLSGYGLGLLAGLYRFKIRSAPVSFAFRDSFYK